MVFALDCDPPTGVLRDVASDVSYVTGADGKAILAEVVSAMTFQKPRFLVLS
jgi:hypothetical protein